MIFIILPIIVIGLYFILNKTKLVKYNQNNILFCVGIFVIFTILQGFRAYEVGTDTNNYVNIYNIVKNSSWLSAFQRETVNCEFGFILLMKIIALINMPARVFLIIIAIIINGGLSYFVYKNSKNPLLSIIIFMGAEFFTLSFTALRQMIAVVIILNAYTFIKENKNKQAIIMILIASMFHITALAFLMVLLFKYVNINKKTLSIIAIIFLVIQLCCLPLLQLIIENTPYAKYMKYNSEGEGIVQLLVIMIYTIIGICIYYKNDKKGSNNILILIMITAIFIQSLAHKVQLIGRMMWYFYIFNMIYLPNLINEVKNEKYKIILNGTIAGLSIAQYLMFSINLYNLLPYKFGA